MRSAKATPTVFLLDGGGVEGDALACRTVGDELLRKSHALELAQPQPDGLDWRLRKKMSGRKMTLALRYIGSAAPGANFPLETSLELAGDGTCPAMFVERFEHVAFDLSRRIERRGFGWEDIRSR